MLVGNIISLKTFLQAQSLAVPGVTHFIFGDALKVIEYSKSNAKFGYPLVHCSKPIVMPTNNGYGNNQVQFYIELSCFAKVDKTGLAADADDKELAKDNEALNVLLALEKKLRLADRAGQIEFEEAPEIEPVPPKWIDAHVGWKMNFRIALGPNSNTCT